MKCPCSCTVLNAEECRVQFNILRLNKTVNQIQKYEEKIIII